MKTRSERIFERRTKKSAKAKSVYLVVCYARWTVVEHKWTGRWVYDKHLKQKVPQVYYYNDHNGAYESIELYNIFDTTTGWIDSYTFDGYEARYRAAGLQYALEKD